jgi:hypothetical protein
MGMRESDRASGSPSEETESERSITPSLHHSITPSLHHSISPSLHHSISPSLHLSIAPLPHRGWVFRAVTWGSFRYNGSSEETKLFRHLIRYSACG